MKSKKLPSPRLLRRLIDYCPDSGTLTWKERPVWMFARHKRTGSRTHAAKMWNANCANKPAINTDDCGYLSGAVLRINCRAHRVAWAIYHGRWPSHSIDHINGDKSDNRIENLRDVSQRANARNARLQERNKSGVPGVFWVESRKYWCAQITVDGKTRHLGSYKNKQDAIGVRKSAERINNFHPNHGRAE